MGHRIVGESDEAKWWRNACVYQVYLRSFKDADGDGNGDINGLREELGHIAALGCDAIWLNPIFRSPPARPRIRHRRLPRYRPDVRNPRRVRQSP